MKQIFIHDYALKTSLKNYTLNDLQAISFENFIANTRNIQLLQYV